jgi:hypothetical protein
LCCPSLGKRRGKAALPSLFEREGVGGELIVKITLPQSVFSVTIRFLALGLSFRKLPTAIEEKICRWTCWGK